MEMTILKSSADKKSFSNDLLEIIRFEIIIVIRVMALLGSIERDTSFVDGGCSQWQNFHIIAKKFGTISCDLRSDDVEVFHLSTADFLDDLPQAVCVRVSFSLTEAFRNCSHLDKYHIICRG